MSYIKPEKLKRGDLIGIISPASSPDNLSLIEKGINYLEGLGYKTISGKNVGKYRGYLAGTDKERIDDIHQMFSNKKVKAIFCVRGGYGASRLLDKINYDLIRNNPKIFVGFSEITSLQMAFLRKANLITFSGPMVVSNFAKEVDKYTEENFWQMITSDKITGKLKLHANNSLQKIHPGSSTGRIVGGNLAVFVSLIGTGFLPNLRNKILFLEDVNEPPYKIDRMMNHLRLNNVFKNLNGLMLGTFVDCNEKDPNKKTLNLNDVLNDYLGKIKLPVVYGFPQAHTKNILTVPIGIKVKVNATKGFVEYMESGVK